MSLRVSLRALALLGLSSLTISAVAQSQYRLFSEAAGGYYNFVNTTSPVFGLDAGGNPNTVSGTILYGTAYDSGSALSQANSPPDVSVNGVWAGDVAKGMTTVTGAAASKTGWGSNHASASLSGFTKVNQSYDGQFVVGPDIWPMHVDSSNFGYAVGRSVWEELYQIGGGTGTGQFTGTIHIDGTLAATTGAGSASIEWSLRTFSDQLVASVTASYDAAANGWSMNIFSDGQWTSSAGSGALTINENVLGAYSFTYGTALYLKSELLTTVSGNGAADFSNTVQFTGMRLPQDATVFVMSGAQAADYGISFGGNGNGTICQDLSCAVGGGLPVPEPQTYALLLSGLGVIAWVARRRRSQHR